MALNPHNPHMSRIHAAYTLGTAAPMCCYVCRYQAAFPWDPQASGGPDQVLRAHRGAWGVLGGELVEGGPRAELDRALAELDAAVHVSAHHADQPSDPVVDAVGGAAIETTLTLTAALAGRHPRWGGWVELGQAVGRGYVELLDEATGTALGRIVPAIVTSLAMLPAPRLQQLTPLRALKEAHERGATPIRALAEAVSSDAPADDPDLVAAGRNDGAAGIRLFHRWAAALQQALEQAPEMVELEVDLADPAHPQALVNGRAYAVSANQALLLLALLSSDGQWVSSHWLRSHAYGLPENARVDRELADLPAPVGQLIERKRGAGGGYRLALDGA